MHATRQDLSEQHTPHGGKAFAWSPNTAKADVPDYPDLRGRDETTPRTSAGGRGTVIATRRAGALVEYPPERGPRRVPA